MEINGLPLHPLLVHAVVVLGPLAGLVGLAYAAVPRWRWALRSPLVGLALVVAVLAQVAVMAGEDLLASRLELAPLVARHEDRGSLLRLWSFTFVGNALLAAWALGGSSPLASGRGARPSRGVLGWAALALLVAGSVGMLVLVFLAGDSGARAVWG